MNKRGAGVIIREDGVILTSYELLRDATQVQVRLSNGEIFDQVDLLSKDERRGVAAIKIPGVKLTAVVQGDESAAGKDAFILSDIDGKTWAVTDGIVNTIGLADDLPAAGSGFRVVQFSAALATNAFGGLLTDKTGRAIGLVVSQMQSGRRTHYAIPLSSIAGLGEVSTKVLSFSSGKSLDIPRPVRPPSATEIVKSDPHEILRDAKIFHVYSYSFYIKAEMMENAMMRQPEFKAGSLKLIDRKESADILINVEHKLFTWDYRYTLTDRRTGIVLASEKVTVIDGKAAAYKFTKKIMTILRKHKAPSKPLDDASKNTT